jgi:peptidylprolyl isomerase
MRRRRYPLVLAALALATTAACGSDDGEGSDAGTEATETASTELSSEPIEGLTVNGKFGKAPKLKIDGLDVDAAQSTLVLEGDGDEVSGEGSVLIQSLFAVAATGKELSSSYATGGNAQSVSLADTPAVIRDTVAGANVGSRIAIAMPASDYFQGDPAPETGLKAEDDLLIVLDLVGIPDPPLEGPEGEAVDPPADAPTVVEEDGAVTALDFANAPRNAPGQLEVIPLVEGDGKAVKQGDSITVNYFGAVWGKGDTPFDESYSKEPATFTLTPGGLIQGWVQGLEGVEVGSRVLLLIPSELGYGAQGSGEQIPPNSPLVFVVDVLGAS